MQPPALGLQSLRLSEPMNSVRDPQLVFAAASTDMLGALHRYAEAGGDLEVRHAVSGWSLLHTAAEMQDLDALRFIAARVSSLELTSPRCRWTALHQAVDVDIDGAIQTGSEMSFPTTPRPARRGQGPARVRGIGGRRGWLGRRGVRRVVRRGLGGRRSRSTRSRRSTVRWSRLCRSWSWFRSRRRWCLRCRPRSSRFELRWCSRCWSRRWASTPKPCSAVPRWRSSTAPRRGRLGARSRIGRIDGEIRASRRSQA